VVAAVIAESSDIWPISVVVTQDGDVLTTSRDLEDAARYPPGRNAFDDTLTRRWADSRVRDEVASALRLLAEESNSD
jgi:hypothetical protein